ncbi:type II restriction endonuclease, partial [Helicobacter pylori]|uniref:type II restriction endonuclease n=1 Tax=Helicobacter pylori TaxID=210 RepID=UPI0035308D25
MDETEILQLEKLDNITSVIKDFIFFVEGKWKIASDKGRSGNTANIGSIQYIDDILQGNGM